MGDGLMKYFKETAPFNLPGCSFKYGAYDGTILLGCIFLFMGQMYVTLYLSCADKNSRRISTKFIAFYSCEAVTPKFPSRWAHVTC